MDLKFSDREEAFRQEVKAFLDEAWPAEKRGSKTEFTRDNYLDWHRKLHARGWIAPAWPEEYGGTGWTPTQRYIFDKECAAADAFPILPFNISMVGPVIYTFGSDEQKERFLPPTLSGDIWWCQGYSEPGAGSDLASLRTRAVRDGDDYIVNGSKTWTTLAQYADWIFCLVRTDPNAGKKQQGISFLLIDMKSPGITVRPIITLGGDHEVNEVFFENVRVPADNLVGQENQGWTYAKFLLTHERSNIAGVHQSWRALDRLKQIAADKDLYGDAPSLMEDADFVRRIAETEIDLTALEFTELRALAREESGGGMGPESSLLKIRGTEIQQRISHMFLDAAGTYGLPFQRELGHKEAPPSNSQVGPDFAVETAARYFNMRKTTIYGGTNEIQRNIIAKMILGL
ncbi:acyl-CoA dehydrogenase family protein [Aquisalinus flavus]|uniref:Acyl-CoA dehydrogenase n=1 Tax=Aquisalinus flavus TaxID=1526572 RepID=A0A8J2V233_9PROT|nr:acyl-CoA dehydrogenase family protein [Aquisalinus flavus]MBD0427048.1 acyl-CoA dehydrogenase family protein [Aquisalinus flavus]UNE46874.1 pimeloyl-CoA dehydrogenase large subunit [Aquisalinus flavus]GGC97967.1 acyl-CoA dehydrogenase [Aquisalinus flavus]